MDGAAPPRPRARVDHGHPGGAHDTTTRRVRDEGQRMHGIAGCEVAAAACSGLAAPRAV